MTHKELLKLERSFNSRFNELIHQLKQKGMDSFTYAEIIAKYLRLSAQITDELDSISLDEQSLED